MFLNNMWASCLVFWILSSFALSNPITPISKRAVAQLSGPRVSMGFGTYPRAIRLRDSTLLGCYTSFSNGNNVISLVRSNDNGASWFSRGESASTRPSAQADLDNCALHQLPTGRVLIAFRNHDRASNGYSFYRITVCYSDDNGASWLFLSTPATSGTNGRGLWEPFFFAALDGSVQLYYSRENGATDQDNILLRSGDGGRTWGAAQVMSGAGLTTRDGMVGVARLGAGSPNLVAVFEIPGNVATRGIWSVTSSNDGGSWGNRRLVYRSGVGGASHSAPQVAYAGNTLVVSFMTDEDSIGNPAVKTLTSANGGANWGGKITTQPARCSWPGELTLDDRTVLVMCEGGPSYAQKVVLV